MDKFFDVKYRVFDLVPETTPGKSVEFDAVYVLVTFRHVYIHHLDLVLCAVRKSSP